jgi:hypothetical protein
MSFDMRIPAFNFNSAFDETCDGTVWGVWVGEHGFLTAVFTQHDHAHMYAASLPHDDWQVDKIDLYDYHEVGNN